ncbi:MAG: hypothetical protein OXI76_07955 [Gemmatimonadota bacterium]|nr:hypothetical protein [Gemmatimonadota bacterium]
MRTLSNRTGRLAASPAPRRPRCDAGLLLLGVLLGGCGSREYRVGGPGGDAAECGGAASGAAAAQALLRVGCEGELLPGRATWSVEGGVVRLDFGEGAARPGVDAPVGADLVRTWPPLGEPPWLGHAVGGIVVEGDGVRVEFAEDADEPARVFADLRLSGARVPVADGDARDAIDAGDVEMVTYHEASIEYARSLGRAVRLAAWDRLYLAVFPRGVGAERSASLAGPVARDWVGWGTSGARRAASRRWASIARRCEGGTGGTGGVGRSQSSRPAGPTISYPEGDRAARQVAERLASAGMRGGAEAAVLAELTGTTERPAVRAASGEHPARAPSDVGAVVVVHAGPGHPCSLHAEVLRATAAWDFGDAMPDERVFFVGEAASFLIGRVAP